MGSSTVFNIVFGKMIKVFSELINNSTECLMKNSGVKHNTFRCIHHDWLTKDITRDLNGIILDCLSSKPDENESCVAYSSLSYP